MKKYLSYILILSVVLIFLGRINLTHASNINPSEPCNAETNPTNAPCAQPYKLLAPLPDANGTNVGDKFYPSADGALSTYLNLMFRIFIGICAVLAVIMIIIGGMQYMTSELMESKADGKRRIEGAILGLLLALSAYALLNTINPKLLGTDLGSLSQATITITSDQANFSKTESSKSNVGAGFQLTKGVTAGVANFAQTNGSSLNKVTVNTASKTATFCAGSNCVSVPINIGQGGVAGVGQGQPGDLKTPLGTTNISGDIRIASGGNAVITNNGYNVGAAFINLGIKDAAGNDRGIGFHGSSNDSLNPTNGCIRMSNEDLMALAPYMKPGLQVNIM